MPTKDISRKLPLKTPLVLFAAIVLAAITYAAISIVRARADESRQSEAAYAHLEAHASEQNALEWRVIAEQHVSPAVLSELRIVRSEIMQGAAEVERLDNDADQGKGFRALYRVYDRAVEQEFRLVDEGKQARAKRFDEKRVDPSFTALKDLVHEQIHQQSKAADRHNQQAQLGTAGALLVTAIIIALLFSRREKARLVLGRLSRQNESILNAAGDGVYGLDREGRVTFANPAAMRMTGHEVGELLGRRSHELVDHTRQDGTPYPEEGSLMAASLEDGTVHHSEDHVYWRKDGTSFPVEFTSTPIVEGGKVTGAVVVFRDITERREVERAKDEFTSVVSHELRTPLTSIRGSLGLLESGVLGPLPEKGQRMVEIAVENTDRLVRLINDILDIERIDSGKIDMHQQPCDAAELIERAIQGVEQVGAEANVSLIAEAQPAALFADPDRMLQTLTNLISNAVKFSPPGSTVRVSSVRRDHEVLFRVSDEGRGIPADKLETVFERFQQVDASDSREKGGTGLGLAICRTIVERHGGRLWAESKVGAGSTFSFVLPAQATNGSANTTSARWRVSASKPSEAGRPHPRARESRESPTRLPSVPTRSSST
jgi:PAS domain S-box-containing protein